MALVLLMASCLMQGVKGGIHIGQIDLPLYISTKNLFEMTLKAPYEILILFFRDGDMLQFTNYLDNGVYISDILGRLKEHNKDIKNCFLIMHNHLTPARFTPIDIKFLHRIRRHGFTGEFGIYYPFSKKVLFYDKEAK